MTTAKQLEEYCKLQEQVRIAFDTFTETSKRVNAETKIMIDTFVKATTATNTETRKLLNSLVETTRVRDKQNRTSIFLIIFFCILIYNLKNRYLL